jgi:16S rRNA (guanine966-N2)-methyltransferase
VAGRAGGRRIRTPRSAATRPTAERVREALFSSLQASIGSLADVRFLDLYAGSGAVGLEAVSRGAQHATLVEQHAATAALARRNATELGFSRAQLEVVTAKVERYAARPSPGGHRYGAAFLDPPYDLDTAAVVRVLDVLAANGWVSSGAVIVVERSSRSPLLSWPDAYVPERDRRYGETTLWYGRATEQA